MMQNDRSKSHDVNLSLNSFGWACKLTIVSPAWKYSSDAMISRNNSFCLSSKSKWFSLRTSRPLSRHMGTTRLCNWPLSLRYEINAENTYAAFSRTMAGSLASSNVLRQHAWNPPGKLLNSAKSENQKKSIWKMVIETDLKCCGHKSYQ